MRGKKGAPDVVARLTVHVQPKAGEDRVVGFDDIGRLRVRVRAAPSDGKANDAVTKLIAGALGVPRRQVVIERGHASRTKTVCVSGLDDSGLRRRLGLA